MATIPLASVMLQVIQVGISMGSITTANAATTAMAAETKEIHPNKSWQYDWFVLISITPVGMV